MSGRRPGFPISGRTPGHEGGTDEEDLEHPSGADPGRPGVSRVDPGGACAPIRHLKRSIAAFELETTHPTKRTLEGLVRALEAGGAEVASSREGWPTAAVNVAKEARTAEEAP